MNLMRRSASSETRFNTALWKLVASIGRLHPWQRLLLQALWVLLAVAAVYFWISAFDCPICN
jgi:hypothetical protein